MIKEIATTQKVLRFIVEFKADNDGVSPSVREIMAGPGVKSTSVANYHLVKLKDEGMITYEKGNARTIQVIGGSWDTPFWYKASQLEFAETG